jgi:hypothetical protein
MALSGWVLYVTLLFLVAWFVTMLYVTYLAWRRSSKEFDTQFRSWFTFAANALASIAILSLVILHVSWVSPEISQRAGTKLVQIVAIFLFFPSVAGFALSLIGRGRMRFLGTASTALSGAWWFVLAVDSGISMGSPQARHPIKFLIPEGYVGWVEVSYGLEGSPPLPIKDGSLICKIPANGVLGTSSHLELGWGNDDYDFYSPDGSLRQIRETNWGDGGLVWGGQVSHAVGEKTADYRRDEFIYIGTEDQFKQGVTKNGLRPPG